MKKLIIILLLSNLNSPIQAHQNKREIEYPEVGKPCPGFLLNDVEYYQKKNVSLNDFKGKWLVIDCWNRFCTGCLHSMPHTDSMARFFTKKVQFLLIGYAGTQYRPHFGSDNLEIRKLYNKLKENEHLDLPIAYDSVFFHRFDIGPCPYIIIVDPKGIVQGITYTLTVENMEGFLAGGSPSIPKAYRKHDPLGPDFKYLSKDEQAKSLIMYKKEE